MLTNIRHKACTITLVVSLSYCASAAAQHSEQTAQTGSAAGATEALPSTASRAEVAQQTSDSKKINYVLGAKFKTNQEFDSKNASHFAPVFGVQLGRWKIGTNPNLDEWLAFSGIRKDPTVSYEFLDSKDWKLQTSLRLQNLGSDQAFEFGDKGKNTVRGRLLLTHRIDQHFSAAAELTQDLLNRGDGTTLSFGVSRNVELSPKSLLVFSTGITWANAVHWRTSNLGFIKAQTTTGDLTPASLFANPDVGAGLGSLGVSLGYRYGFTKQWAVYANTGFTRAIADLETVRGTQWRSNFQLGLLYFGQF
jgi:hypothetical protein